MRQLLNWVTRLAAVLALAAAPALRAEEMEFDVPAQAADRALLTFAKQARVDILFSFEELHRVRSHAISGRMEPERALAELLRGTGFVAHRTGDAKWVVTRAGPPTGTIKGQVLAPDGLPARRLRVSVQPGGATAETTTRGRFTLGELAPGTYTLEVAAPDTRPLRIEHVQVVDNEDTVLNGLQLLPLEGPTQMEPYVVESMATHAHSLDHSDARFAGHVAGGNLDLTRTESDTLPYMIFNRSQIARSGVVNLNEFLQRELIDSTPGVLPPEQDPTATVWSTGSTNLSLRGYTADETVILVNGRRLPEMMVSGMNPGSAARPPDVNFIPLSLVQQVEVLPVSASSLYTGNAVGGVINIVLRPDVDANATEVNATYTNALGRFDAPQESLSLLHARTLLDGRLRLRFNANVSRIVPATEAELGYRQRRAAAGAPAGPHDPLYGATPNVRSADGSPLFGAGTAATTSVAPGADGTGGLGAFAGREGRRNAAFFDSPGAFSTALDSLDLPYGREEKSAMYYASAVWVARPWLQLALDATYSSTIVHRGFEVFEADLPLKSTAPTNPFGQDVLVSLNEVASGLGENYREARFGFESVVLGTLVRLPDDWRLALDTQLSHSTVRDRELIGADVERWKHLLDTGAYNPFRDTQIFGPPAAFYDQVLIYRGGRGHFVTLGDYTTLDAALRFTNERLHLPTGEGIANVGADYRRNSLGQFTDEHRYGDGSLAATPDRWSSRAIARYSFFGELQAPLVPKHRLPRWIRSADADLALRYVASSNGKEANFAPTYGLKLDLAGGFALRASVTTSSRYPSPNLSRPVLPPPLDGSVVSPNREEITDYRRGERYTTIVTEALNPDLQPESALTQTAGVLFERGVVHRFRAAIDFVETHKTNEEIFLDKDKVTANEALWPERVVRAPAAPGEALGLIRTVYTGRSNLASRTSQNWTASFDYRWDGCLGGTLEAYARALYYQSYHAQLLPTTPMVDELNNPDATVPPLRYRANFGASWSNQAYSFGADGHFFGSRVVPQQDRAVQGGSEIPPFWQADVFVAADVGRWLPWKPRRYGLRLQVRVNNILNSGFPKWANDMYGTGVQPYGDWRGRVYSVSLTAKF